MTIPQTAELPGLCQSWGYGGYVLANLFAYRAISPNAKAGPRPDRPDNDKHLKKLSRAAAHTVCAWGNHGVPATRSSGSTIT